MASNLEAMASNLEAMACNLEAMAPRSDGLQPTSDGHCSDGRKTWQSMHCLKGFLPTVSHVGKLPSESRPMAPMTQIITV